MLVTIVSTAIIISSIIGIINVIINVMVISTILVIIVIIIVSVIVAVEGCAARLKKSPEESNSVRARLLHFDKILANYKFISGDVDNLNIRKIQDKLY